LSHSTSDKTFNTTTTSSVPKVAVILTSPAATAVTKPAASTVATASADEA